jgi:hypothetical protein
MNTPTQPHPCRPYSPITGTVAAPTEGVESTSPVTTPGPSHWPPVASPPRREPSTALRASGLLLGSGKLAPRPRPAMGTGRTVPAPVAMGDSPRMGRGCTRGYLPRSAPTGVPGRGPNFRCVTTGDTTVTTWAPPAPTGPSPMSKKVTREDAGSLPRGWSGGASTTSPLSGSQPGPEPGASIKMHAVAPEGEGQWVSDLSRSPSTNPTDAASQPEGVRSMVCGPTEGQGAAVRCWLWAGVSPSPLTTGTSEGRALKPGEGPPSRWAPHPSAAQRRPSNDVNHSDRAVVDPTRTATHLRHSRHPR